MNRRTRRRTACWVAIAAALAGCACGGRLEIRIPPDGGPAPLPDGGWPDAGQDPPGPPDPARTALEVTPTAVVAADGLSRAFLRVTVRDASGRVLPGVNVSFSASGAGHQFSPLSARGTTGGDGTLTVGLASTRAEEKTVTAALAAFALTAQVTFVPGPPSLGNSGFQLGPSSLAADGVQAANLLVTLRDRSGNAVAGHEVYFDATGTSNLFTPSPAIVRTGAGGTAQASLTSTRAEPKTAVATVSGSFVLTQPVTFVHGPASLATSSILASPTLLVADGVDATTARVVVRDAQGNPLPGQVVVFTVSPGGSPDPSMPTTNVDGEVVTQLRSTVAETKTITALAAGLTLQATVRFGPGAPSTTPSTLTATPATLPANGTQATLLTVTLKDDAGNPVPDAGVAFSATGSANRFTPDPPSGRSDVSGVFSAQLSSTVAEAKTVFATTSTFALGAPVTFTVGPPSQTSSRFSASPQQLLANGAEATTMTVVVRDAFGNPVPGQAVTFSASGTGNTLAPASATTSAAGSATATLRSTKAELKTLTATFAGLVLQTTVSFLSGPPSQAQSTLAASPSRYSASDEPGTTLTATIRDAFGNPLQARTVDFTASGAGNAWSINPPSGPTDVNGVFSVQLTTQAAGAQTLAAMCDTLTLSTGVTVDPGPPSLGSVVAQPAQLRADGVQTTLLTLQVLDFHNNPVPGYPVTLEVDRAGTWVDPTQGSTDAQGRFSARLKSTVAEEKVVTGRAGGLAWFATVVFTP